MRSILSVTMIAVFFAFGCGGGGSGGGGDDDGGDDGPAIDAADQPLDAPDPGAKNIGSTCTPDQANPQGDCPTGFVCLTLQGSTNPWCSKACNPQQDTCSQGYMGTGLASCFLQVTPPGGGTPQTFCGVVCDDQTANDQICPASKCDGTCPGSLVCTAELKNQQMMVVAKGCQ
jgi:hypothetical protein